MIRTPSHCITHLARTGGDAVRAIVGALDFPDWDVDEDQALKHETMRERGATGTPVITIRRLPSYVLSVIQFLGHGAPDDVLDTRRKWRHGTFKHWRAPHCLATMPDGILRSYWQPDTQLHVQWLRMEHLRDDLLDVLPHLIGRRLTDPERLVVQTTPTKLPRDYDHDWAANFTEAEVAALYANNPLWAKAELEAYGDNDPWQHQDEQQGLDDEPDDAALAAIENGQPALTQTDHAILDLAADND